MGTRSSGGPRPPGRSLGRHSAASTTSATSIAHQEGRQISCTSEPTLPASIVDTGEVQALKQLGDPLVGQYLGVVFGRGPIDGQQPVAVAINAAMISHSSVERPWSASATRVHAAGFSPSGLAGVELPRLAPALRRRRPSSRCTNAYSTTPLVASEESTGAGVVAQK